ncbi:MAG: pyruvate kinase [Polyangiaceae bacterium]|nr:pyruvate kinase [Polyangiaceae bacterium]
MITLPALADSRARLLLVATIGPASFDLAADLFRAGADALRVNGSHMSAGELDTMLTRVRAAVPDMPVVLDLQGAKMRLGRFEPVELQPGQAVRVAVRAQKGALPLPHPELFRALHPGDTLSCDDHRVRLRVDRVDLDSATLSALGPGTLRPRKGVNVLEHPVDLDDLTSNDLAQVEVALRHGPISFACSFMRDGREAGWIRRYAPGAQVVGKIERAEAIENLASIAREVQSAWVCRGDLGAQLGMGALAQWVSSWNPSGVSVPVLMAGQVLEHLTAHADPTRSEVCHLYDLIARGYSGFVLSDETAIGADPVHAVKVAVALTQALVAECMPLPRDPAARCCSSQR